jgi:hypothetical protein
MADYQLTTADRNGPVLRTADQAWIPNDPANRDWQEYQQWLADGGVPDPVPPKITPALDAKPARTTAEILGVA